MNRADAYRAVALVEGAAIQLGNAMNLETQLADERALVKHAGIQRLLDAKTFTSVTAAEKGIEFDQIYLEHRGKERAAVADRIFWEGKFKAAALRAQLAVQLCAIDEPHEKPDYEIVGEHCPECLGTGDGEHAPNEGTLPCKLCQGKGVFENEAALVEAVLNAEGVPSEGDEGKPLTLVQRVRWLLPAKEADFSGLGKIEG